MRTIKFRIWDEKYNAWDKSGGIVLYPDEPFVQQGRIFQEYIGMNDKNGKEIYEGDIIQYVERLDEHGDKQLLTGEIMFDHQYAAWAIGRNGKVWSLFSDYGISNIDVIGNKFENADYLKYVDAEIV